MRGTILSVKVPAFENYYEILPAAHWLTAIEKAKKRLILKKSTLADMKSCLAKLKIASDALKFSTIPISEISREHIKIIFEYLEDDDQLSAHRYNKYRWYLMIFL